MYFHKAIIEKSVFVYGSHHVISTSSWLLWVRLQKDLGSSLTTEQLEKRFSFNTIKMSTDLHLACTTPPTGIFDILKKLAVCRSISVRAILCLSLSQFSGTKSWKTQCSFEKWKISLHWNVKSNVTLIELDRMLKIATLHRIDFQRFLEKCLRHGIAPNSNKPYFALSFQRRRVWYRLICIRPGLVFTRWQGEWLRLIIL